jgi:photosystem II stability/assembly factor-like uncharacterized protein
VVGVAAAMAAWASGAYVADRRADLGVPVDRLTHVHGLDAPAWANGALLVGTHTGLVRWSEARGWRTVGTDRHDLMGFRADPRAEGTLYASGHPDLRRGLPNPLGLIVSRDGGRTWTQRSLGGVADLHALASSGGDRRGLLAWDAIASTLLRSDDGGATWATVRSETLAATGGVLALEVHPSDPDRVFAATASGLFRSGDGGATWAATRLQGAPVTSVRQLADALWAFAIGDGARLQLSRDDGATWASVAAPVGSDAYVTAIAASAIAPDTVFVATSTADVLRSDDGGATWTPMVVAGAVR